MDLFVWPGDFGLPTWHQPSLALLAYCRFTGAPCTVRPSSSPILTGAWRVHRPGNTWDLPVLVLGRGGDLLGDFERAVSHLERHCRFSTEVALSRRQRAESVAFRKMVEDKLGPATAFVCWVDPRNLSEVTRPWFARRLKFPMAFVHPPCYKSAAEALVSAATRCSLDEDGLDMAEMAVARAADECMAALSHKLGDKPYLFGAHPTALDAVVLSHLAPLARVPWPGANRVRQCLQNYPNLGRMVTRMLTTYFAKECAEFTARTKEGKSGKDETSKEAGEMTPAQADAAMWATVENVASCALAVSVMFLYGYGTGLFHNMRLGVEEYMQ